MPTLELSNPAALPADWRDFVALTKPRVMSLVVFSGLCGLLVAPVQLPPVLGFTAILCIALAARACGALNQWYEADIEAKMRRSANRQLPAGGMPASQGSGIGGQGPATPGGATPIVPVTGPLLGGGVPTAVPLLSKVKVSVPSLTVPPVLVMVAPRGMVCAALLNVTVAPAAAVVVAYGLTVREWLVSELPEKLGPPL